MNVIRSNHVKKEKNTKKWSANQRWLMQNSTKRMANSAGKKERYIDFDPLKR